ncbi:hypothetical protein ACFPRL_03530 [Pseudoclavibacter helvolus]
MASLPRSLGAFWRHSLGSRSGACLCIELATPPRPRLRWRLAGSVAVATRKGSRLWATPRSVRRTARTSSSITRTTARVSQWCSSTATR